MIKTLNQMFPGIILYSKFIQIQLFSVGQFTVKSNPDTVHALTLIRRLLVLKCQHIWIGAIILVNTFFHYTKQISVSNFRLNSISNTFLGSVELYIVSNISKNQFITYLVNWLVCIQFILSPQVVRA